MFGKIIASYPKRGKLGKVKVFKRHHVKVVPKAKRPFSETQSKIVKTRMEAKGIEFY